MKNFWIVPVCAAALFGVGCRSAGEASAPGATVTERAATDGLSAAPRTAVRAPESAVPDAWYEREIWAFEAADRADPPEPGRVLFIGSSSFRLWKTLEADMVPVPVLNRGFGGSKTGEVLAVFDRIVVPYAPSVIVYYCGDNDL
ncbi:MAG: hypothetical protein ACF8LK_02245, partial [Phycisphaerales bacterium JB041]